MRKVELDFQLGDTEIIALQEKAGRLLESPEGQKILREISALDALVHLDKVEISPREGKESGYTTDDYRIHLERFSITDFYPVLYFVEDALLLTSDTAFTHRTRLENQIADEMPDLYARLQEPEFRVIAGNVFRVKEDQSIQFFAVRGEPDLHLEEIRSIVAKQLAERGILLLFWSFDFEWEAEQLKKPKYARYAAYNKRVKEARNRFRLFAEWGNIVDEFGGIPESPRTRYKWTIISPFDVKAAEIGDVNHSEV